MASEVDNSPVREGLERGSDLDPDIRRFADEIAAAYARHPGLDAVTLAEARAVCEQVRAPWVRGGPQMRIGERQIETPAGPVRLRVYDPVGGQGLNGALVYLHGGGWMLFSLDTHDRLMREYAARAGVMVVGVDYALSPEAKFPVALHQTAAAIRWLSRHGAELGVDPRRLAVGGDSAGGNLSLSACLKLRDEGDGGLVSAMLLNYGAFDDACSPEAARLYGGPRYTLTAEELGGFWSAYLGSPADRADPLARPLTADLHGLPPAFLTIPECDVLTEQSFVLAERLRAAGVATTAQVYAGAAHSFLEAVSISALAGRALQDGANWLQGVLAPQGVDPGAEI